MAGRVTVICSLLAVLLLSVLGNATEPQGSGKEEVKAVTASASQSVTYQGVLKDASENPIPNAALNIIFRVYDDPDAGDLLWQERINITTDKGGYFSAVLSHLDLPSDRQYYLSLQVEGDAEMSPRQILRLPGQPVVGGSDPSPPIITEASHWADDGEVIWPDSLWGISHVQRGGGVNDNVFSGDNEETHINLGIGSETGHSLTNASYSTIGGGYKNKSTYKATTVGGGESNEANATHSTISGGKINTASGDYAAIGGGDVNEATATSSTVGGGSKNKAQGSASTVGGGKGNTASSSYSTAGGGSGNTAGDIYSTISGGRANSASDDYGIVGGGYADTSKAIYGGVFSGYSNLAGDATSDTAAFVGGGYDNSATDVFSTVSGGKSNKASGNYSIVGGGRNNGASYDYTIVGGGYADTSKALYGGVFAGYSNIAGDASADTAAFVGGGYNNSALDQYVTVCGGKNNTAGGYISTISGGEGNTASVGAWATIGGGRNNTANVGATVAGGTSNTASVDYSAIGGGTNNVASGLASVISGGYINTASAYYATVCGGRENNNAGEYSVIPGGYRDTLTSNAEFSLAFGNRVYIDTSYRVIFFDSANSGRLGLNRDYRDGGVSYPIHVGTHNGNGNGAYLSAGGTWTNGSSRGLKENFEQFNGTLLLSKISGIAVESWNYRESEEKHIGPMAEEFVATFDVGSIRESDGRRDDKYLAASDVAGVALAGVKELIKQNRELSQIIEELQEDVAALKNEIRK